MPAIIPKEPLHALSVHEEPTITKYLMNEDLQSKAEQLLSAAGLNAQNVKIKPQYYNQKAYQPESMNAIQPLNTIAFEFSSEDDLNRFKKHMNEVEEVAIDTNPADKERNIVEVHPKFIEPIELDPIDLKEVNIVNAKDYFEKEVFPVFPEYDPDTANDDQTVQLENEIRSGNKKCSKPSMLFINDVINYGALKSQSEAASSELQQKGESGIGLYLLQGCDSYFVATLFDFSVRQVASQFNSGESSGPSPFQPNQYKYDKTQGPAEQRAYGGAAFARYFYKKICNFFSAILANRALKSELNTFFDYRYGYLTPKIGLEKEGLEFLKKNLDKLLINIERVKKGDKVAYQVLNAAMALDFYDLDHENRTDEGRKAVVEMSRLLLGRQYEAVAAVSTILAQKNPNQRIRACFTMVGGGVFGNDKKVVAESLNEAIKQIKQSGLNNIDICLSIFASYEIDQYKEIAKNDPNLVELKMLLAQPPLKQEQLKKLNGSLPTPVSNYANGDMVRAMQAAINALSGGFHLSNDTYTLKSKNLHQLLNAYKESANTEEANKHLLQFIMTASKQRESRWSLFTSKFGETSSTKALFKEIHGRPDLQNIVMKAMQLEQIKPENKLDYKQFVSALREKHEGDINPASKKMSIKGR